MKAQKVKISKVKLNPDNPRLIRDDNFEKLVKSVKDFPEMMEIRPIVVNKDFVIIGGNMRYRAAVEAGFKEINIIMADNLSTEQEREFIIKDNVSGGEWDFDMLPNSWEVDKLEEWGMNIPKYVFDLDINNLTEDSLNLDEEFDPVGVSSNIQRVVFLFDGKEEAESYLKSLKLDYKKRNMAWQVNLCSRYI